MITKKRALLPLFWCIGILLGINSLAQAQTCPSGWTSVANGTTYPVAVTGTATVGDLDNILFGGADGNTLRADAGVVVDFGQTLVSGGSLSVVAAALAGTPGSFNVTFSADGVNFVNPILTTIPTGTTALQAYTITAPVAFRYARLAGITGSFPYYDAVSYQGSFCQAPTVSYASCGSGESQVWRYVEPTAVGATAGLVANNVARGPDGLDVDLTTSAQSVITKYAKAFAIGDTVVVTGYKYSSSQVGDFQVLTSLDGVNFTALPAVAFTNNPSVLQTVKVVATQAFQYVKVMRSGFGQVSVDAIKVMGQVCITTPSACASGSTYVTNAVLYPVAVTGSVTGSVLNGDLDNILFGGADGNYLLADAGMVVDFGQTLAAGGTLSVVAAALNNTPGSFSVTFSADGVNFQNPVLTTIPTGTTIFQAYTIIVPQAFRYVKFTVPSGSYPYYDAMSYRGEFCQAPTVSYASCGSGESQVWRYVEPVAVAATPGITASNVAHGPDGLDVDLTTSAQSVITKYAKVLASGDTIVVTGYKYVSTQAGDFQVLTSLDGVNFTALPAVAFTNVSPNFQTVKVVATQAFQYVKVIRSGFGQVTVDAVNVVGKTCVVAPAGCNLVYTSIPPQEITGTVYAGFTYSALKLDGLMPILLRVQAITADYGQTILPGGDVYVVAKPIQATGGYIADFSIAVSNDGVNFVTIGSTKIPGRDNAPFQTYQFHSEIPFRYARLSTTTTSYVGVDYIGAAGLACPPCNVTATTSITQATCTTAGGANANAAITLAAFGGGATKVGYSVGSSYTGPAFAAATTLTTAPFTVMNTLPNPTADQPYTVRVFGDAACYQDYVVTLSPKLCLTADLSLAVSPATATGNKGEQVTYTFTLTNAGPDAAPNVTACIAIPSNTTFLSATTSQGAYDSGTTIWNVGTVPVGSQTITLTLQMK